jgi:hypothetical protein
MLDRCSDPAWDFIVDQFHRSMDFIASVAYAEMITTKLQRLA